MIEQKLLLISHVADNDGITPIILAKLVYKEVDTILLNPGEVDKALKENIDKYDLIHITDVSLTEEYAKEIDQNEEYRKKIKLFDHHITAMPLNKYSFATVITEQNGQKESATSIYYKYLLTISNNEILHKKVTKELVEQVRLIDTYDFKNEKDKEAMNIGHLFNLLGKETYEEYFTNYIKHHDIFEYTEKEKFLIKLQTDKVDSYIQRKSEEMFYASLEGYKVGIVFAESNKSLLGNYLVDNKDIDFAILIGTSGHISYRANGKVDLSKFTEKLGGGGHKNAAGSPFPEKTRDKIIKIIFPNIKILEEEQK